MHYSKASTILSSNNGMNIYRGCSHGCIYCDSRSEIYGMNHEFEDIEVKSNSLFLLKKALKSRKKAMIGTGSMADPYQPIEKHLKYTRRALKLICRYGFGFTAITKSDLVLRDLDLLKKINEKSKVVIQMTMTTYDEDLCKVLEPNVCTTFERFKVLKRLWEENIPTVVWITPLLPFINDDGQNLEGILEYCIDAGVVGIIAPQIGLTLRKGNREYFYQKLDENFPGLKERYIEKYGESYSLTSPNSKGLMKLLKKRCRAAGIMSDMAEVFEYLHDFPRNDYQTKLF